MAPSERGKARQALPPTAGGGKRGFVADPRQGIDKAEFSPDIFPFPLRGDFGRHLMNLPTSHAHSLLQVSQCLFSRCSLSQYYPPFGLISPSGTY
jgi:hypothetical protein